MGQLAGKTAIITGASTGIGKGIAQAFVKDGANLVVVARNKPRLEATAEELRSQGSTVIAIAADITDEAQVVAMFEQTVQEFGQLDILVNNAGAFDGGPIEALSLETWQKVIDVNLTGSFLCSREAMIIMKHQGQGRIINIGSISAQMPRMNSVPYTASKFGLVGLTRATALEGREYGVVVSCLHPGNVATEFRHSLEESANQEPMMTVDELATTVVTMAALPAHVNMLEAIVLPTVQPYLGRG